MRALVDALSDARPKSPASQVDNEEPIELAHYPDAMKPPPGSQPPIERDDFPAPPYPYTDPERRKRWSDTYKVYVFFRYYFQVSKPLLSILLLRIFLIISDLRRVYLNPTTRMK